MRPLSAYCIVVDVDVKSTHVEDVPTATAGSMPMTKKKGENTRPPPMPTRPAKQPVAPAMHWKATAFCIFQSFFFLPLHTSAVVFAAEKTQTRRGRQDNKPCVRLYAVGLVTIGVAAKNKGQYPSESPH